MRRSKYFEAPIYRPLITAFMGLVPAFVLVCTDQGAMAAPAKKAGSAQSSAASSKTSEPTNAAPLGVQAQRSLDLNERGVGAVRQKEFANAESLFKQAVEADTRNLTAVFNLAGMYLTNKKEVEAVNLLEAYLVEFPTDAGLHARLGDAYFASKKIDKATKSYEEALKLDQNYPGVPSKLGTLYSLNKKLPEAERMFLLASKQNQKDPQVLANLSSLYLSNGKPKEAVQAAKSALQLRPSADTYITLGNAYQQLKEPQNALNAFTRAKALGSTDPALEASIEHLRGQNKTS